MAFPDDALYVRTELYHRVSDLGVIVGGYRDISTDVYNRDGIKIGRGRGDESSDVDPTTVALTLNNRDGVYSPRNPLSPLYKVIGRNTPIRVTVGTEPVQEDTFTRTTSNGWTGTGALSWVHSGGTVPDDYDVNGSQGTHTLTDTGVLRNSYMDTGEPDHRVRVTFDLSADDITGGTAEVWITGRMTDSANRYILSVTYSTAEAVTLQFKKLVNGIGAPVGDALVTSINISGIATSDLIGELYVEGNWLYGKVWRRFADEPLAWMITEQDDDLTTGNGAGVASRRNAGNTNANLQARFLDFTAVPGTIRANAEVSSWPSRWDVSGRDVYVPVEAAGILRRLGQGARPLRSALWREVLFAEPLAFWPLTDGKDATTAASALPDGAPMPILKDGEIEPRQINAWTEPLLTPKTGEFLTYNGPVNQPSTDTTWSTDLVFAVDEDAEDADLSYSMKGPPSGLVGVSFVEWILTIEAISVDDFVTWGLIVRSSDGVTTSQTSIASGTVAVKDGRLHHARLITSNSGANTDWELLFDNSSTDSGTTAQPWLPVQTVRLDYGTETAGQMSAGFAAVYATDSPPFNAANAAVVGRSGETAGDRLERLLGEEGIPFQLIGATADTEPMGPQTIATLVSNIRDCEDADMGVLYEPRYMLGLGYRTRSSLYNPAARLELTYGQHVSPPFEPVEDDQRTRNDVTVSRPQGSSARAIKTSGSLNINPPWEDPDGVGVYDESVTVNVDLDDQLAPSAQWRLHKGTWDEARYKTVKVNLRATPDIYVDAARVDVGDAATVDSLPSWLPAELAELVAEGGDEVIGLYDWEITFNTSPAGIYSVGVYDDTGTRYDSGCSTTSGAITTGTSTSLSVAVEAGRGLWSTTAAPFDIDLLGARVTVTAVSGASSPQTFTISTTVVNGINKSIPAGTPVRLWKPKRYGM